MFQRAFFEPYIFSKRHAKNVPSKKICSCLFSNSLTKILNLRDSSQRSQGNERGGAEEREDGRQRERRETEGEARGRGAGKGGPGEKTCGNTLREPREAEEHSPLKENALTIFIVRACFLLAPRDGLEPPT